jgi:hypothetical protein
MWMDANGVIHCTYTSRMKYQTEKTSLVWRIFPSGRIENEGNWHAGDSAWWTRATAISAIVNPALLKHKRRVEPFVNGFYRFQQKRMVEQHTFDYETRTRNLEAKYLWKDTFATSRRAWGSTDSFCKLIPDKNTDWGYKVTHSATNLTPVKDWNRKTFYKAVNDAGRTHLTAFQWDMPRPGYNGPVPGDWHDVEGELVMCRHGIHVCTADMVGHWVQRGTNNLIVEMDCPTTVFKGNSNDNKLITRKARVKRVVADVSDPELHTAILNLGMVEVCKRLAKGQKIPKYRTYKLTQSWTTTQENTYVARSMKEARQMAKGMMHNDWNERTSNLKGKVTEVKDA